MLFICTYQVFKEHWIIRVSHQALQGRRTRGHGAIARYHSMTDIFATALGRSTHRKLFASKASTSRMYFSPNETSLSLHLINAFVQISAPLGLNVFTSQARLLVLEKDTL